MKSIKGELSEELQRALKGQNLKIMGADNKPKYIKQKLIEVYKGYDMLENLFVVRDFVQKKYEIDLGVLELLLKLMGMKIFTRSEYNALPRQFTYMRLTSLIDQNLVNIISDHWDADKMIFTLSTNGRNIVISFYEYLVGEKRIPETAKDNPLVKSQESVAFDRKKLELIKKLNQLPVPPHKGKLFE